MTAPGPERILITEQSLEARLEGVGDAPHGDAPHWDDVDGKPSVFPPEAHTHTSSQVSDATATGRAVMTAASQSAARTAIGAGTSNLALGTTASTAKAGNYHLTWSEVTGKPATFPPVIGTTSTTAKAGNYVPSWSEVTSKPTTFTPTAHTHPVTDLTATGTRSASTYLRGDGSWATPPNTTYAVPTQAEAEAGTATTARAFSAQRVRQAANAAIAAREWVGTQAQYNAIGTKNPNITYYIVD